MNLAVVPPRRPTDPGAPRLRADVTVVVAAASAGALAGAVSGGRWAPVAALAAGIVVVDLLALRLTDGSEVPLSYALVLPLVVVVDAAVILPVLLGAHLLAAVPDRDRPAGRRLTRAVGRAVAGMAGFGAFRGLDGVTGPGGLARVTALAAASLAVFAVELVRRRVDRRESFVAARGPAAAFAIGTSGVLMGVGVAGTGPAGAVAGPLGLWAVPVFMVPLLAARWAFDRLHAIRRTYDQTIEVLSVVPEMGGRTRPGHSRRVADLSVEMARLLGLDRRAVADLERAALLHSLGHVALEEPEAGRLRVTPGEVGRLTSVMLADAEGLSDPARLVALSSDDPAHPGGTASSTEALAAEVLRVATAFEQAVGGDPRRAQDALELAVRSAGGVDDRRVVAALEQVVLRRSRLPVGA